MAGQHHVAGGRVELSDERQDEGVRRCLVEEQRLAGTAGGEHATVEDVHVGAARVEVVGLAARQIGYELARRLRRLQVIERRGVDRVVETEVRQRALRRAEYHDPRDYHLLLNNCEHTVHRLAHGKPESPQLQSWVAALGIAGAAFALTRHPGIAAAGFTLGRKLMSRARER